MDKTQYQTKTRVGGCTIEQVGEFYRVKMQFRPGVLDSTYKTKK